MGADPNTGGQMGGGAADALPQMVEQYAQSRDPQLATQIAETLVEIIGAGAAAGGADPAMAGGAPAGDPMAAGGAPMGARGMALPVYGTGGSLPNAPAPKPRFRKI